jgi:hypothetical protein
MKDVKMRAELDASRTEVTFQMTCDGEVLAQRKMNAQDIDDTIRNLAEIRERMADQIPDSMEPSFRMKPTPMPAWIVPETHPFGDGKMLVLRHPGFGWLGFYLEPKRAKEIAFWLAKE